MSETRGPCPAHQSDTNGSDSYFWNDAKGVGSCHSCGLSTWLHSETGELWGKTREGRKFKIEGGNGGSMVDTEDFGEAQEKDQGFTPKGITEGVYQPWRGVTEATMEHFGVTTQGDHIAFV